MRRAIIVLALAACVALPLYAFWNGHPFRIRYMVPVTMSLATFVGIGVGLLERYRGVAAAIVVLAALCLDSAYPAWTTPTLVPLQQCGLETN